MSRKSKSPPAAKEGNQINEAIFDKLVSRDPAMERQAVDQVNEFTREQMMEDNMSYLGEGELVPPPRILPLVPITNDELDRKSSKSTPCKQKVTLRPEHLRDPQVMIERADKLATQIYMLRPDKIVETLSRLRRNWPPMHTLVEHRIRNPRFYGYDPYASRDWDPQEFRTPGAAWHQDLPKDQMQRTAQRRPIPVRQAAGICREYDKDMVLVLAYSEKAQTWFVTTFGVEAKDKQVSAMLGDQLGNTLGERMGVFEDFRLIPQAVYKAEVDKLQQRVEELEGKRNRDVPPARQIPFGSKPVDFNKDGKRVQPLFAVIAACVIPERIAEAVIRPEAFALSDKEGRELFKLQPSLFVGYTPEDVGEELYDCTLRAFAETSTDAAGVEGTDDVDHPGNSMAD